MIQGAFVSKVHEELIGSNLLSSRFLIALSGGPDSVAMLWAFKALEMDIQAAHVNYGLRGEESKLDEQFCLELCEHLGIKIHIHKSDPEQLVDISQESFQNLARDDRYRFFEKIMNSTGIDVLCTAHHFDDSIETFFINLLRGTGIRGLIGIPHRRENIFRPLLNFSKVSIKEFLDEFELPFRIDKTNVKSVYVRNQIRNELIPKMKDIQPNFDTIMSSNLERLMAIDEVIRFDVEKLRIKYVDESENVHAIDKTLFKNKISKYLIYQLFLDYSVKWKDYDQLLRISVADPGKKLTTSSHEILNDRNVLWVYKSHDQSEFRTIRLLTKSIDSGSTDILPLGTITYEFITLNEEPTSWNQNEIYLNPELVDHFSVRSWKSGDRMNSIGMAGHHQKVSDILTNLKVSQFERSRITVLEAKNTILWIVGYKPSEHLKSHFNVGQRILKLTYLANSLPSENISHDL